MKATQTIPVSQYQRPVDLIEMTRRNQAGESRESTRSSFRDMFSRELANDRQLSFSKHAEQRLFSRGIELSDEDLGRIANAVDKAAAKGSRETLVLLDDAALVVAVSNRTVITAFDRDNLREGVVTSIDSAVVL